MLKQLQFCFVKGLDQGIPQIGGGTGCLSAVHWVDWNSLLTIILEVPDVKLQTDFSALSLAIENKSNFWWT